MKYRITEIKREIHFFFRSVHIYDNDNEQQEKKGVRMNKTRT